MSLKGTVGRWIFILPVALLALVFVYRRGQDQNWDLQNYHYYAGYALLNGRQLTDLAAAGIQSFLNPLSNVLVYLSLSHLSFPASAWVITLLQLLSLPLLVMISTQLGSRLGSARFSVAELLALCLSVLAPLWWSELGTSFSSSLTAPLMLGALYLGVRSSLADSAETIAVDGNVGIGYARQLPRAHDYGILLAGGLLGFAAGLKLTNALFAIGFIAALACSAPLHDWRRSGVLLIKAGIGMFAGFGLTAWWNVYLLQVWDSPLFPWYNGLFKSPYFDTGNFRDMRWYFASLAEFARFLVDAVTGSGKTSEVAFADARLLLLVLIAPLALRIKKRYGELGRPLLFFMLFVMVSLVLWARMFAYQRYLIPIELLFGLALWVLLSCVVRSGKAMTLSLGLILALAAATFKIPDWGHVRPAQPQVNAFGLNLPPALAATPAQYLVLSSPLGFILPFLHPDSRFYGVQTAPQIDALIRAALAAQANLPVRVLSARSNAAHLWSQLQQVGFTPQRDALACSHFRSYFEQYMICGITPRQSATGLAAAPVEIDLRSRDLLPSTVLDVLGLSAQENWGRWSDGRTVKLLLANCLPASKLDISIRGHAFGPNVGQSVQLGLESTAPDAAGAVLSTSLFFAGDDRDVSASLDNRGSTAACLNILSLTIPKPTSPAQLGLGADNRALGLGMVSLTLKAVP
ncbi:MAG: DUF2029 domain-containing protein [Glaciimonas sp.]|nr:DUF2029 domain-containing protein [Glaciimonas sp.]